MKRPDRFPPDDPREWMNRARGNLALARARAPDVYLEDLCFQAQQAAEKAVKALSIQYGIEFPYTHDLARLLSSLRGAGERIPDDVLAAASPTPYATRGRYPGGVDAVSPEDHAEAVRIAEATVQWAEERLRFPRAPSR